MSTPSTPAKSPVLSEGRVVLTPHQHMVTALQLAKLTLQARGGCTAAERDAAVKRIDVALEAAKNSHDALVEALREIKAICVASSGKDRAALINRMGHILYHASAAIAKVQP